MAAADLRALYRRLLPQGVREYLLALRRAALASRGAWRARGVAAGLAVAADELRHESGIVATGRDFDRLRRDDVHFDWLAAAVIYAARAERALGPLMPGAWHLILAHETLASAYAGLRLAQIDRTPRLWLDNVEYPVLGQRSGAGFRTRGLADPLADSLTAEWQASLANRYEHVFATSEGQLQALRDLGMRTPHSLLRNARLATVAQVDQSIREDCGCAPDDVLLLFANNAYPGAGVEPLLDALALLPPCFKLCFLGELRDTRAAVASRLREPALAARVTLRGAVPPERLVGYASGADISVVAFSTLIANHVHSLPNRLFESLAARNPLLVPANTEIGRFVLRHGIGACFADDTPGVLAAAIEQLATDVRQQRYTAALEKAATSLTWEHEQKGLQSMLAEVRAAGGHRALLLACKPIARNDRIRRLTGALLEAGMEVTVAAHTLPDAALRQSGAHYARL